MIYINGKFKIVQLASLHNLNLNCWITIVLLKMRVTKGQDLSQELGSYKVQHSLDAQVERCDWIAKQQDNEDGRFCFL